MDLRASGRGAMPHARGPRRGPRRGGLSGALRGRRTGALSGRRFGPLDRVLRRLPARIRPSGPLMPLFAGALVSLLVLVAGLAAGTGGGGPRKEGRRAEAAPPSPAGTPTPLHAPGYTADKPVIDPGFADPDVIKVAGVYYAYGTNDGAASLPVATAPSPTGPWTRRPGDGLARLPAWASAGWTWAPEVVEPAVPGQPFVLYFSARRRDRDIQCVGVATATSPAGPFVPVDGDPIVCPADLGGAIDPDHHVEPDGTRYLLYKSDALATSAIWAVKLTPDGLRTAGEPPHRLIARDASDPILVEAPALVERGGQYVLFYSSGRYYTSGYQTRYAVAPSLFGPYRKEPGALLSTGAFGGTVQGPGSVSVLSSSDGADDYLVYHGIRRYLGGSRVSRAMYVGALVWDGARPAVRGPAVRYEAERGRLNGCVQAQHRDRASGASAVGLFDRNGCALEIPVFAPETGRYKVRVQYADWAKDEARLELTVNGASPRQVRMSSTRTGVWASVTVDADLGSGWNSLALRRVSGRTQVDFVEVR
ncbi:family 43 glycosylhydrolase [Spirillospora sp. NPDC049652]